MTNSWFRSWHGAPVDNKWLLIAKRAGVEAGIVSAIVWALLDYASSASPRGDVSGFDIETYSVFSGFTEDTVKSVLSALNEKKVIVDGRLASWDKRQPKREDGSAERAKAWRESKKREENLSERKRTKTNAREDTDTDTEYIKKGGTRLSSDWTIPDDWVAWSVENTQLADVVVRKQATRFKNHYTSLPDYQAYRTDWFAIWKNWITHNEEKNAGKSKPNSANKRTAQSGHASWGTIADRARAALAAQRSQGQNTGDATVDNAGNQG